MDANERDVNARTVERFGFGLAALGRPGYINLGHGNDLRYRYAAESMRDHAWTVLDAAYTAGIRHVDVARSYGRAEEFVAGWLKDRAIHDMSISSKWGYTYTADWSISANVHEVKDHTLTTLQRQWAESLAKLGPWLRLYQVHSATEASGILDRVDVLDELARLRDEHAITIGLTVSGPDSRRTLERTLTIERSGSRLFSTVQATWNVLEPSLSGILRAAHAQGVRVIVKEALANGRLTDRNSDPGFSVTRAVLEREAMRLHCTLDQLALAVVLDQPWADRVLSGAATVDQISSNIESISVRLDDEARSALEDLAESPDQYWRTRSRLTWN